MRVIAQLLIYASRASTSWISSIEKSFYHNGVNIHKLKIYGGNLNNETETIILM